LNAVVVDVVNEFFLNQPYTAAALTCGVKASAADFVAQRQHLSKRDGSRDEIEISEDGSAQEIFEAPRNIAFLLYGAVYQGIGQEFIYNHLYSTWFGNGTGPAVVATKVAFDLLIQTTLLTLPVAYLTKATIFRYPLTEGLRRYIEDITTHGLLLKYFALWGPVQCLTFSVVPIQARVPFIALVSFFWLIILSSISSRPRKAELDTSGARPLVQFDGMDEDDLSEAIDGDDECLLADGYTCSIDG
jgi:protein Mpv17